MYIELASGVTKSNTVFAVLQGDSILFFDLTGL